jgi:DNA-binding beta-propeller fold protein YncE
MNIFTEPEFRFTAALSSGQRVVSCQATNTLILTEADGSVVNTRKADFNMPQGIAVSSDHAEVGSVIPRLYVSVFVVDRYNGCVKVFKRLSGSQDLLYERSFGEGMLNQPVGIAINRDAGLLYVADNENHRIAVFTEGGEFVEALGRGYGQEPGQLFCPCGVALYKGLVIVAEWGNGRIQVFRDGAPFIAIGGMPHAHDVVVGDDGEVFLALYSHKAVQRFKITFNDDGSPCFEIVLDRVQLEHNPTSLFLGNDGKLGVVTKTKLLKNVY